MFGSENEKKPKETKHKIELSDGQVALMRISRIKHPDEFVDVSLKVTHQSDSSWILLAKYDNQNQEIQLDKNNKYREISAENSICRRRGIPYINLSQIIPQNWHETRDIFQQYKGGGVLLNSVFNNFEIYSPLPNITFIQLENKK